MKIKSYIISLIFLAICFQLTGQSSATTGQKDKFTLLTMPYINRPLTLYAGQLQVNTGYKFAVRARAFDNAGKVVELKKDGNSSVLHYYFVDVKFGITNFLEAGAELNYMKRGVRTETVNYMTVLNTITVNTLTEYRGMGDMFLYASARLPWEYKWFDFRLTGGIFLPTAKSEPLKPTNTYVADAINPASFTVNYHFNNKNGFGVPVGLISAGAKVTYSKFALEAAFAVRNPVKEGTSIRWEATLTTDKFDYYDKPYQYLLDKTYIMDVAVHYQPVGWFNIYLNTDYTATSGGWTEYWGNKYRNPGMHILTLEPAFEIQVSPSLTIYQVAGFPVSGKNSDASFSLFTTISYNLFPFLK